MSLDPATDLCVPSPVPFPSKVNGWKIPSTRSISGSEQSLPITSATAFSIACYRGTSATPIVQDRVSVVPLPVSIDLKANGSNGPISVPPESRVALSWTSNGLIAQTDACVVDPLGVAPRRNGWTAPSIRSYAGSEQSLPLDRGSRTFHIACYRGSDSTPIAEDSVTVNVFPPSVDLKANGSDGPISVPANSTVTLSWVATSLNSTTDACFVSPTALRQNGWKLPSLRGFSGSETSLPLTTSTSFTIVCYGGSLPAGTNVHDSVTVNITP